MKKPRFIWCVHAVAIAIAVSGSYVLGQTVSVSWLGAAVVGQLPNCNQGCKEVTYYGDSPTEGWVWGMYDDIIEEWTPHPQAMNIYAQNLQPGSPRDSGKHVRRTTCADVTATCANQERQEVTPNQCDVDFTGSNIPHQYCYEGAPY